MPFPDPSSSSPSRPQRIALVSCVKSKRGSASAARDLYVSPLFQLMRAYAEANADRWYILSAEYGLVRPDQTLEPYERTLNRMGSADREAWAARVRRQLDEVLPNQAHVIVLAGTRYRENLIPYLRARGCEVSIPLEGLSFGRQLQRLNELVCGSRS